MTIPSPVLKSLGSIQTLRFIEWHSDVPSVPPDVRVAYAVALPSFKDPESSYPPILRTIQRDRTVLGIVDTEALTRTSVEVWANFLSNLVQKETLISGVVLRENGASDKEHDVVLLADLLGRLAAREVPVVLCCHHDSSSFDSIDFGFVGGVIIENACILPDGSRRDYFRSMHLRQIMERCAAETGRRSSFFVGFHDVWDEQPSAAVICRAVKVARHFGAVFEHGPKVNEGENGGSHSTTQTTSGFEFLRRPETCEVRIRIPVRPPETEKFSDPCSNFQIQTAWLGQKRKVRTGSLDEVEVACLDVEELESLLPGIGNKLKPLPFSGELKVRWNQEACPLPLPRVDFVALAPPRVDFWESSAGGEKIAALGCLPLTLAATSEHHELILETQDHLKNLKLLHLLDQDEIAKVVERLRLLLPVSTQFHLVRLLIDSLLNCTVSVYKGLGTGFVIPDTAVEFWAATGASSDGVDIFLSRRSPDDTATVLHAWLAHHGVSRLHRYEEELRLDHYSPSSSPDHGASLPRSIRAAIDRATPSETLFLLEQLQVSQLQHRFRSAIEEYCSAVLLDETSLESWNDAHVRQYLEGSIDIRQLLQRQQSGLIRMGATRLPTLDSLTELHTSIDRFVTESLFRGNVEALNLFSVVLEKAYDPLDVHHTCKFVDVNADLLALMFFCSIRKAALEDVYLEATDRCPIFSQPDQAAVFSELWVLGSQCQLYFGMTPRALGKILYDKHRRFLQSHPPKSNPYQRKPEAMTVYAKPDPQRATDDLGDATASGSEPSQTLAEFGALSVFCFPAMFDIALLTFLGRGLFMTAYMGDTHLISACYALLAALLLSAGITGWVGSVGNYYLSHVSYEPQIVNRARSCHTYTIQCAYGNMIHFHVQRLSSGFVLSWVVGATGAVIIGFKMSIGPALVFLAYHILIATYLNLLGAYHHSSYSPRANECRYTSHHAPAGESPHIGSERSLAHVSGAACFSRGF